MHIRVLHQKMVVGEETFPGPLLLKFRRPIHPVMRHGDVIIRVETGSRRRQQLPIYSHNPKCHLVGMGAPCRRSTVIQWGMQGLGPHPAVTGGCP